MCGTLPTGVHARTAGRTKLTVGFPIASLDRTPCFLVPLLRSWDQQPSNWPITWLECHHSISVEPGYIRVWAVEPILLRKIHWSISSKTGRRKIWINLIKILGVCNQKKIDHRCKIRDSKWTSVCSFVSLRESSNLSHFSNRLACT